MKKFFKGLGVISVPALCVYAIVGAVVIPLLIFETGASKESNPRAEDRTIKHWNENFALPQATETDPKDELKNNFKFTELPNTTFKVDGRDSKIWELYDVKKDEIANKDSEKLVVFTHGLNSTHWNAMETAFYWKALGYRVISWDQRGGGENRSSHITFGYSEADDLSNLYKVIDDSKKAGTTYANINETIIYGQSNGAATTISFADRYQDQIKKASFNTKFIEESGYTSPKRQFETALNLHGIMPAAVVPLTIPMYELYADKNLSDENADYLAQSGNITQPLFIVHGDEDPIVDFQMGVDLYKKMKANSESTSATNVAPSIYIGKGLGHIGVSRTSDINGDASLVIATKAFFEDLATSTSEAEANAKAIAFSTSNLKYLKHKPTETYVLAGFPDAVRFFFHEFMWDKFGTVTEEGGGHLG